MLTTGFIASVLNVMEYKKKYSCVVFFRVAFSNELIWLKKQPDWSVRGYYWAVAQG